jgi:hypothetical protein
MALREIPDDDNQWSELSSKERQQLDRLFKVLSAPETSELATGKSLLEARALTEPSGNFLRFLETLPFTVRTAYRRIRMYEKARDMWPLEIVDRAIQRRIPMIGVTADKPMGAYEDLEPPAIEDDDIDLDHPLGPVEGKPLGERIEDFLIQAELQVRLVKRATKSRNPRDLLKKCFRAVEQSARHLSAEERADFLNDLVGLEMTLLTGTSATKEFIPARIPDDFWLAPAGGYSRTPEIRSRSSESAREQWKAKSKKLKKRA